MSDSQNAGFGKFVPGFDFLQNLAKGATQAVPQMPTMSSWIAPSLNEEELDKRISELKAVHFWLDQNAKALGATVQALEVQKLTLATLKSMNLSMGDMANAFKLKAADTVASEDQVAEKAEVKVEAKAEEKPQAVADKREESAVTPAPAAGAAGLVDPMQLWTALTQQFQHIAAGAMKEAGKATAMNLGKGAGNGTAKTATSPARKKTAAKKVPAKKAPVKAVKKAAAKTSARGR
ncbi:PhaM family polyhydroxyalkanoate granule multifunctional regulatory protein [Rhodoferax sp.]|uniref:PhaM family polyhydroxyalkanoate granule multifunctional regulatory protein n=1 Tax=Rhodoferax sp. TaxID=50421 RepID=UPI0025E23083|nr:PhaM family polyhydroxyalkanoate granule multifunctional regulatory protein [Rhodoferax sp.]MCM2295980.1 hypothetical protein [Rhodoferax sp.]